MVMKRIHIQGQALPLFYLVSFQIFCILLYFEFETSTSHRSILEFDSDKMTVVGSFCEVV